MAKNIDIVVYGATGYTGKLVAEYLHTRAAPESWAIAGRSMDKLKAVHRELGLDSATQMLVADADNPQSLVDMVDSTNVVLTTVGPYQLYGSELVRLCAEKGTDYVDLCGEPVWMRHMIDAHEDAAKASGARIVFSCGFDSIPFDLGVYFLQQNAKQTFNKPLERVKGRVKAMKGTFSGGTAASLKATLAAAKADPSIMGLLLDPFALTPGFKGEAQPPGNKPVYEEEFGSWSAPFIMAAINTRNIQRSNHLSNLDYSDAFVYDEMIFTGPGDKGEQMANAVASDKSLGGEGGPKPGEGPTKEEREAGFYEVLFAGTSASGESMSVVVTGDKDPGYGSTSKMITESALALVEDNLATKGGIWTPATALGDALITRLKAHAGLTFNVV